MIRQLGKGAHSRVYQVQCKITGQKFGMKVVSKQMLQEQKMTERIKNQIKIHYSLRHKNILHLVGMFEDRQNVYLILELCARGELFSHVKSNVKLQENQASRYFKQIVQGIIYLHSKGVMHRDLKLGNILFGGDGYIKIADFGLAVQLSNQDQERATLCGTPNYISPEIIHHQKYGLGTDIWSLGCILYALLVGKPPFQCSSVKETLKKIENHRYHLPKELSVEAKDLLINLLQTQPELRLTSQQIIQHPFLTKDRRQPIYILKGLISQVESPNQKRQQRNQQQEFKDDEFQAKERGMQEQIQRYQLQQQQFQELEEYKKKKKRAAEFRSAEKPVAAGLFQKTATKDNIFKTTQKIQKMNLSSDTSGTPNQASGTSAISGTSGGASAISGNCSGGISSENALHQITPFAAYDQEEQQEKVELKQIPRPTSPIPNAPMLRQKRHLSQSSARGGNINMKPAIYQNFVEQQQDQLDGFLNQKGISKRPPSSNKGFNYNPFNKKPYHQDQNAKQNVSPNYLIKPIPHAPTKTPVKASEVNNDGSKSSAELSSGIKQQIGFLKSSKQFNKKMSLKETFLNKSDSLKKHSVSTSQQLSGRRHASSNMGQQPMPISKKLSMIHHHQQQCQQFETTKQQHGVSFDGGYRNKNIYYQNQAPIIGGNIVNKAVNKKRPSYGGDGKISNSMNAEYNYKNLQQEGDAEQQEHDVDEFDNKGPTIQEDSFDDSPSSNGQVYNSYKKAIQNLNLSNDHGYIQINSAKRNSLILQQKVSKNHQTSLENYHSALHTRPPYKVTSITPRARALSGKNSFLKLDPSTIVMDFPVSKKTHQPQQKPSQPIPHNPKNYTASNKFLELKSKFGSSFNQVIPSKNLDIIPNNKKHSIVSRSVSPHDIMPSKKQQQSELIDKKRKAQQVQQLRRFSTQRLNQIHHINERGNAFITETGWVRIQIPSSGWILLISPNCKILKVSTQPNVFTQYTIKTLPKPFWQVYQYASEFVNVIKSKTPKIVLRSKQFDAYLMENSHCFELVFKKGPILRYQIASERVKIREQDGKTIILNTYQKDSQNNQKYSYHIQKMYQVLRKILKIEKQESEFPCQLEYEEQEQYI